MVIYYDFVLHVSASYAYRQVYLYARIIPPIFFFVFRGRNL